MTRFYLEGIYAELGSEITRELVDANCTFAINYDNLEFTFLNCPKHLIDKILAVKEAKGTGSLLYEYAPALT